MQKKRKRKLAAFFTLLFALSIFSPAVTAEGIHGQPMSTGAGAGEGRAIVLLLDNSNSMKDQPIQVLREAAGEFCTSILQKDEDCQIALVEIGDPGSYIEFTSDERVLAREIEQLDAGEKWTNVHTAIARADKLLKKSRAFEKNIVIMTDGLPSAGKVSAEGPYSSRNHKYYSYANAVYKQVQGLDDSYRIFSMGFFHRLDGSERTFARRFISDIGLTKHYEVTEIEDLLTAFETIAYQILNPVKLTLSHKKLEDTETSYTYRVTAKIQNPNEADIKDLQAVIDLDKGMELSSNAKQSVSVGDIQAGRTVSAEWELSVPRESGKNEAYTYGITVKADNIAGLLQENRIYVKSSDKVDNGFQIKKDIWNFNNYIVETLPITDEDLEALIYEMEDASKAVVYSVKDKPHNGQCYGMSASSILFKVNHLDVSNYDSKAKNLKDLKKDSSTKSLIAYYQISELFNGVQKDTSEFMKLSVTEQLKLIETQGRKVKQGGNPFVLSFGMRGGGHSVVAYGYESGSWKKHNYTYDSRILVYDCNYAGEKTGHLAEDSYLYFNKGTDQWQIPNYYNNGACSGSKDGYLMRALDDMELIDSKNIEIEKENSEAWVRANDNTKLLLETGNHNYKVDGDSLNTSQDGITAYHDTDYNPEAAGESAVNVLVEDAKGEVGIKSDDQSDQSLDVSVYQQNTYITAELDSSEDTRFQPGSIKTDDTQGEYKIEMTTDETVGEASFHQIRIAGEDAGNLELKTSDQGYLLSGDNLKNISVTVGDFETSSKFILSTDSDQVVIASDSQGEPVWYSAENMDEMETLSPVLEQVNDTDRPQIPKAVILIGAGAAAVVLVIIVINVKKRKK